MSVVKQYLTTADSVFVFERKKTIIHHHSSIFFLIFVAAKPKDYEYNQIKLNEKRRDIGSIHELRRGGLHD